MPGGMTRRSIAKYLNPWMFNRAEKQRRFAALRERDGDNCWRCRRPMRFDLPRSHDHAPTIEHRVARSKGGTMALDNLCLCHAHCNRLMGDSTLEAKERMRRRAEEEDAVAAVRPARAAAR